MLYNGTPGVNALKWYIMFETGLGSNIYLYLITKTWCICIEKLGHIFLKSIFEKYLQIQSNTHKKFPFYKYKVKHCLT